MRQLSFLCALLLLLVTALPVLGQGDTASAIEWLRGQVREDGGFTDGFNEESGVSPTTEAVYAAVAAGEDVSTWGDDASPLDFLAANAEGIDTTGTLAKVILAARATGQDATNFGGVNLVERLNARYNSGSGLFEGIVTEHAYAMLALAVTGNEVPEAARQALVDLQDDEGGWAFDGTSQADTNTTALAIQALLAVGEETHSEPVSQALAFLAGQQNEDGGFPYQTPSDYGTDSDANSTAWAIQALVAAGEDPGEWNNPQEFLATLQMDEGAFKWQSAVEGANFLATAQAVPALEEMTFVDLPVVAATTATADAAEPAPQAEAAPPATLPVAGDSFPWSGVVALAILLLLGGRELRQRIA